MGLVTTSTLTALRTQVYKSWQTALDATETWSDPFFTNVPSTTNINTYGWMAAIGDMREWIGPRAVEGLSERSYTILNKTYEKTIGVQRDKIEDSDIASTALVVAGMAESAKKLPDTLLKSLLQNGHLATATSYDGQNFFDTDHPQALDGSTGTQSNYLTSTALSATNAMTALATMLAYKGENGRTLARMGTPWLVVPPALMKTALDIAVAPVISTGGTNVMAGFFNVKVVPDLAGQDTTWYIIFPSGALGPFIKQNRRPLELVTKTSPQEDNVFWDNQFIFGSDVRVGAGYGLWQLALKAVA